MENNPAFKLIDGKYSPEEAKEVLYALISHKINFNQMAAFSAGERFNGNVNHYNKRVAELKEVRLSVAELIEEAVAAGMDIKVAGSFTISFVPREQISAPVAVAGENRQSKAWDPEHYLA